MQNVSTLYNTLWNSPHYVETKVEINGVSYYENDIYNMQTSHVLYGNTTFTLGSCVAGQIKLKIKNPSVDIPKMAKIRPYIRLSNYSGTQKSEWVCKGEYYIDTREVERSTTDEKILTIHGFDAMLMLSETFTETMPSSVTFPLFGNTFLNYIRSRYGLSFNSSQVEEYVYRWHNITIPYPENQTWRDILGYIGLLTGGNWIIGEVSTGTFGLVFVPANTLIVYQQNILVDEDDNIITVGGDRIIV